MRRSLAGRARQRAGTLSGGERQMLARGRRLHREGLTLLLAEQSVALALEVAGYAYVRQTGRTVLTAPQALGVRS